MNSLNRDTKPNGWEQDIKEDLYAIGAKPIHFEMNNAGVRIINKIHQAILSAEDNMRKRCVEAIPGVIIDLFTMDKSKIDFIWGYNQALEDTRKALDLATQNINNLDKDNE